jgi:hypothetical protein
MHERSSSGRVQRGGAADGLTFGCAARGWWQVHILKKTLRVRQMSQGMEAQAAAARHSRAGDERDGPPKIDYSPLPPTPLSPARPPSSARLPAASSPARRVSRACACIGSPCLRRRAHGASIGERRRPLVPPRLLRLRLLRLGELCHSGACIGSPCLRRRAHGASIGAGDALAGIHAHQPPPRRQAGARVNPLQAHLGRRLGLEHGGRRARRRAMALPPPEPRSSLMSTEAVTEIALRFDSFHSRC